MVERLLSHEARKQEEIERARKTKEEQEMKEMAEKSVHRSVGRRQAQGCIERLIDDAKARNVKMEDKLQQKAEKIEEELKGLFRPKLVASQIRKNEKSFSSQNSQAKSNKGFRYRSPLHNRIDHTGGDIQPWIPYEGLEANRHEGPFSQNSSHRSMQNPGTRSQ